MKQPPDMPEPIAPVCPYCRQILDKRPKRKTKCPHCDKDIYVRARQHLFPSTLLTEQDARVADHLERAKDYGLEDADFAGLREQLSRRFAREPSSGDVLWALFQDTLQRAMKSGDLQQCKMLYLEMALFVYEEGREFFHLLEQSRKMELTAYKRDGFVDRVFIITAGDASCEACQELKGTVFTIDDALEQMPIPCRDCTFDFQGSGQPGWCRCLYGAVVD
jgi:hypothetical protein